MSTPSPVGGPPLSRRSLAAGALATGSLAGLVLLAGCDGGEAPELPGLPPAGADPDRELALTALARERVMVRRVRAARSRHPRLRGPLRATLLVHREHVRLLAGATGDHSPGPESGSTGVGPAPRTAADAVASLVRAEDALRTEHVATAMAARSGPLARLAAGMAAASAQQAVVLAELPERGR